MSPQSFTPDFKTSAFKLNSESGYYERVECDPSFTTIPSELKVEETRRKEQIHSSEIVRGRIKDGRYLFFTGILPTEYSNLFFGDHYEYIGGEKRNSFVLFHFSQGNSIMTVYFYRHFKLYPGKRSRFIDEQVLRINRRGGQLIVKRGGE